MGNKQTNQELRELLFDKYNKNLCLFAHEVPSLNLETDKYYCPLCFVPFNKDAIFGENPLLTLEHIVPQNSKGKLFTLTCRKCNNNLGSKIDSSFSEHNKLQQFAHDIPNVKFNIEVLLENDIKIGGSITNRVNNTRLLHMDSKRMDPKLKEDAINSLSKPFKGTFKINMIDTNKLIAGYVKAAYLYAFSILGYPYIWTINSERIRASIINGDDNIKKCVLKAQLKECGLYIITEPQILKGYLVSLPFNNGVCIENISIILPGFTTDDNYKYLEKDTKFEYISINTKDILTNKSNFLFPLTYWQNKSTFRISEI